MENAQTSPDEVRRLAAVKDLAILDTPVEERFDRITKIATKLFDLPISTLTIMDSDREWFKSCQGVAVKESPRIISFCDHVVSSQANILVVKDTRRDPFFAEHPMVVGAPYIRFYAGVPIFSLTGERVGVFCIKDTKPRDLSESDQYLLQTLASWAELEVNIISLKHILDGSGNSEYLKPLLKRLLHRNVIENLKSIKFGLRSKLKEESIKEQIESEEAIAAAEELIAKIQNAVGSPTEMT